TGNRMATICDGYSALAPPVPAGTVCVNYPKYEVSDWSGATRPAPADNGCGGGALSTDGALIANCQGSPRTICLVARDGSVTSTSFAGNPLGWIDARHLVMESSVDSSLAIIDTRSLVATRVEAQGFFAGAIPGSL